MPRKIQRKKCLAPSCKRLFGGAKNGGGRGLCKQCHWHACKLVRLNRTTWKELEQLGLAEPVYKCPFELEVIKARKRLRRKP